MSNTTLVIYHQNQKQRIPIYAIARVKVVEL